MKDETLLKISLIFSITGIFILLFILEYSQIDLIKIQNITQDNLETQVKIQGELVSVKETPGLYILKIDDQSKAITVIVFKEEPIEFKKGTYLEITGEVQKYKDELEIIADKIILK